MNKKKRTKHWNKNIKGHWKRPNEVAEVKMGLLTIIIIILHNVWESIQHFHLFNIGFVV